MAPVPRFPCFALFARRAARCFCTLSRLPFWAVISSAFAARRLALLAAFDRFEVPSSVAAGVAVLPFPTLALGVLSFVAAGSVLGFRLHRSPPRFVLRLTSLLLFGAGPPWYLFACSSRKSDSSFESAELIGSMQPSISISA